MKEDGIKRKIRKVLAKYRDRGIYVYMPVPGGYGESSLDYLGFYYGHGFAIEAKRPGGKPTARQADNIRRIRASGAAVFVIDDEDGLQELDDWLATISTTELNSDGQPRITATDYDRL